MKVLLIDDEVRLAEQIRRGLGREGFTTVLRHNGPEGLAAARERSADVIVCDVMLPGLSGYEIVRQLRRDEIWTPILMLTAKDGEYDEADAFDLGADDYLTKPFSLVVLVARLRSLLRRGAPERPATMVAGDLMLDPSSKQVMRAGTEISMTPREFSLLELLIRRKGQVLSKREILETVWDPHHDSDPNVVEVYVGYLRRKIDAPFRKRSIITVRGMGYRLDPDGG